MIYKTLTIPDRSQTMLAYRIKYWPWTSLSESARRIVTSHKIVTMKQGEIMEGLFNDAFLVRGEEIYEVVWAYNNVPTQQEWERRGAEALVTVEFRNSPAIPGRYVAILRFRGE